MTKKHVKFIVPGFGSVDESMNSYLRLGFVESEQTAGSPDAPPGDPAGEDLAGLVQSFDDDERRRCAKDAKPEFGERAKDEDLSSDKLRELILQYNTVTLQAQAANDIWLDLTQNPELWLDEMLAQVELSKSTLEIIAERIAAIEEQKKAAEAVGPPNYCENYVPPSVRKEQTARLHTKGGWRDHTDGNRIITTRGDKLEVVGGNYRMIVMGRVQNQYNPAGQKVVPGWDISGGHIDESGTSAASVSDYPLPDGAIGDTKIEWVKNWKGTWKVKETTVKGDTESTSTGDNISRQFGHHQTSYTGSENPAGEFQNPVSQSKSWAESTHSYTGSQAWPVPLVKDESWVDQMLSTSVFDTSYEETFAKSITSKTTVKTMVDETFVGRSISSTIAGDMTDTSIVDQTTDITRGNSSSITIGTTSDTTTGFTKDITIGASSSVTIGPVSEITIGLSGSTTLAATADITIGARSEVMIGGSSEAFVGGKLEFDPGAKFKVSLLTLKKELITTT